MNINRIHYHILEFGTTQDFFYSSILNEENIPVLVLKTECRLIQTMGQNSVDRVWLQSRVIMELFTPT